MGRNIDKANQYIQKHKSEVNSCYREKFHAMGPIGWINDPNGFVYYRGEYHLFYQFYPYDSVWGSMHWGHSKSKDLIHWEELPVALAPDQSYDKDGCFSGSAVVVDDHLVLMYTGFVNQDGKVRQTQCMAYSSDGVTFNKSPLNPVIAEPHIKGLADIADFRDPKMFVRDGRYYAVVASKTSDSRGQILLFQSDNAQEWSFKSVLLEGTKDQGIMWECPDLFELDGKWVLLVSPIEMKSQKHTYKNLNSTVAFIGEVDWESGKLSVANYHEIDGGLDFYAPQTCLDDSGNRMMIAWMQMWERNIPTHDLGHGWAGMMSLPRQLSVKNNRLCQKPVSALYDYCDTVKEWQGQLTPNQSLDFKIAAPQQLIELNISRNSSWTLTYPSEADGKAAVSLAYHVDEDSLSLSRENFGYAIKGQETPVLNSRSLDISDLAGADLKIEIVRDTSSVEVFINREKTMSMTFYEKADADYLSLSSRGITRVKKLSVSTIRVN
ncbi:glycoside hydrolase family 32 protein [Streptococcus ratti]|uniref:Sucrose-6-phosphate hydrolase n=1 Tax=Streptococcus ratti TaxID=1341 RepID=A0A7X9LCP9_STRRT|nr:glycoside hydrolase family 32 protein [Streptococcus ratti]NMD48557.1 glycoside hydrolase family 32 protein [Streptococcus ratti]